jgi:WhiB family transcriptional regulator, redox-sensing transcriptional regulator
VTVHDVPDFDRPLCAEVDPEIFFYPDIKDSHFLAKFTINKARQICGRCEHREPCAEYGLHNRVFGVWGGLSESERKEIRKLRGIVPKEMGNTYIISESKKINRKGRR